MASNPGNASAPREPARCSKSVSRASERCSPLLAPRVWKFFSNLCTDHDIWGPIRLVAIPPLTLLYSLTSFSSNPLVIGEWLWKQLRHSGQGYSAGPPQLPPERGRHPLPSLTHQGRLCCVCGRPLGCEAVLCVWPTLGDPGAVARQAPLSVRFSRQEHWSRWPCPPPGEFPDPGTEPRSPPLQADSLPTECVGMSPALRSH